MYSVLNNITMYCILLMCIILCPCIQADFDRPEGTVCFDENVGYNGTCYNIHRCRLAIVYLELNYNMNKIEICSFEDDTPIVCCTMCPEEVLPRNVVPIKTPPKVGDRARSHCNLHFNTYKYECVTHATFTYYFFHDSVRRCTSIGSSAVAPAGGYNSKRHKNPHMVLLGYGADMDSAVWLCAGSTISPRFVLTAAHCTYDRHLGPVKFMGTNMWKRSDPYEIWDRYNIKNIYNHPEYHPPNKYNDIALLEMDQKIKMSPKTLPACLPYNEVNDTLAYATGWGANTTRGALFDVLQRVDLEKFTDEECSAYYPVHRNLPNGYDKTRQMCYGHHTEVRDTCPGDSGGPLQVQHFEKNCAVTIIGVTSYGKACGSVGEPGMYTRVAHYLHWIESIVWPGYVGKPRTGVDP